MAIPSEIRRQISEVRRDNPSLTANMSDEEVLGLIQQADLALALQTPIVQIGMKGVSARECGIYGEQLLTAGRWREAEAFFLAQLEKGEREADLYQQADACISLGRLCRLRGDKAQAMVYYRQAQTLAEESSNRRLIGVIYNELGEACRMQGNSRQAIEHYSKSLEIAKEAGNEQDLSAVYGNLGIVHKNQGDFERAIQAYEKSLEYSTRIGLDHLTANQYGNLGVVYQLQGRFDLALEMQQNSLKLGLRIGDQQTILHAYGNLGNVHQQLGNYPAALQMYQKVLDIMQRVGDERGVATTYGNMANLYTNMGDMEQALAHYERALKIMERIGDRLSTAMAYFNLGQLYHKQGQAAQACVHFQKAQALFEMVGDRQGARKAAQALKVIRVDNCFLLTYPEHYEQESERFPGDKRNLRLIDSAIKDGKDGTLIRLVYQWDATLSREEAKRLDLRARAYIACAIYDAAISAGLFCQAFEIRHGRRPSWLIEDERIPISLTKAEFDFLGSTSRIEISPSLIEIHAAQGGRTHWAKLLTGFKTKFSNISV